MTQTSAQGARVAVIDYGIGNLRSAQKALEAVGADARLTAAAHDIAAADAVVLPGVGAFGACMDALRATGLERVVHDVIGAGVPFLGVCVGMQMLFDGSDEDPSVRGLGVIPGRVRWLGTDLPRPQMQWNRVEIREPDDPLFATLHEPWMYFVHSLHGVPDDPSTVSATCRYGERVHAAFRLGNVAAVQFHPEKSGRHGLELLGNFVRQALSPVAA